MEISSKKEFMQLLAETLASYGKALPEGSILTAWWSAVAAYPLTVVRAAFQAYCDENGEFAPVPAGIAMRCKKMDGRPDDEEAWAIALMGQDESSTVVWTAEIAEAFNICRPVLISSGAISARKPFLAAHKRLVAEARAEHRPVRWIPSLGLDKHHQVAAIQRAVDNGLLPASAAVPLLEGPASNQMPNTEARAQLAVYLQALVDGPEKMERIRLEKVEIAKLADEESKRHANDLVAQFLARGNGA